MPWDRRVTLIADDAEKNFREFRNKTIIGALSDVVLSSPVDTGRYRGNHQISQNRYTAPNHYQFDRSGQATIGRGAASTATQPTFALVWLTNNLPYAEKLEEGSSPQAPDGVMRSAFRRLVARSNR